MNDMTTDTATGTAIALPKSTDLAALFKADNGIAGVIEQLEAAARAEAKALDAATKKGRAALISLAAKVSSSKAELDRQGKALTEAQRKEINAVNAGRKVAEDRLAALRDEIRKPVTDWEVAEEARTERHKAALARFNLEWATAQDDPETIRRVISEIEATPEGSEWEEYEEVAAARRATALTKYRADLVVAEQREEERAELARLRAEAEDRARKDVEEAAAKAEAERLAAEQAEQKRLAAEKADADRIAAERAKAKQIADDKAEADRREQHERDKAEAAERARVEAQQQAESDRVAAEERHKRELAEAKAREEAAAQRERDRLNNERKAEAAARAKREKDKAHRARIRNQIAEGLNGLEAGNWFSIADALIDGKVPHVEVKL